MRIDFALFGERGGAHELLYTTLKDDEAAFRIRGKTDRPPFAPPGYNLQPFTSSFADGQYYVFTKAFSDDHATRGGMVTTTAIFVDLDLICRTPDIRGILSQLPTSPTAANRVALELENLEETSSEPQISREMVEALVLPSAKRSIVWLGPGFELQLASVWRMLWPETRRNFAHRLAFDPQDLSADQPTIVTVPEALESRWSDFTVVQHIRRNIRTLSGDTLLDVDQGRDVRRFKEMLGVAVLSPRDIAPLTNITQTYNTSNPGLDELRSSLHTIGRLCPSSSTGVTVKAQLIDRTARAISAELDATQIRAFRNLDLKPFEESEQLCRALRGWVAINILDIVDDGVLRASFDEANSTSATFARGIEDALEGANAERAVNALGQWIDRIPERIVNFLRAAIKSRIPDQYLARVRWKLSENSASELIESNLLSDYPYTKVTVIALSLPLQSAVQHLNITRLHAGDLELMAFLRRVDVKAAFDLSLSSELGVLTACCILHDVKLLDSLPLLDVHCLLALSLALEVGLDPLSISEAVLSRVLAELSTVNLLPKDSERLWKLLLDNQVSLVAFSERATCWQKIPGNLRPLFLSRTADAWIDTIREGEHVANPERELEQTIIGSLRAQPPKATLLPTLVQSLPSLDEDTFTRALLGRSRASSLDRISGNLIGEIVIRRGWRHAAESIYGTAKTDFELRPVLSKCYGLLGRLQRLRARWLILGAETSPTETELWTTVEELALELYSWGPGVHDVWERAGGDPSLIRPAATGAEAWHHVLTYARNGGGDVTLKSLCDAMSHEYSSNEVLQRVREYLRKR